MKTHAKETAQLGELVMAVFDRATQDSTGPRNVSRLATLAVAHVLPRHDSTVTTNNIRQSGR